MIEWTESQATLFLMIMGFVFSLMMMKVNRAGGILLLVGSSVSIIAYIFI